jgi:hypothetical protein
MLTREQFEAMLPDEGGWHITEYNATVDRPIPYKNPYKDNEVIVKVTDDHMTIGVEVIPRWDAMPGEPLMVFYLTVRHNIGGTDVSDLYSPYTNYEHNSVCGAMGGMLRCIEYMEHREHAED